jgi:acetylornithine/N-succinyldiaminopimelate aminotransferase
LPVSLVIARRELLIRACGAVATNDLRPIACGLIRTGMRYLVDQGLIDRAGMLGGYLQSSLNELVEEFPTILREARGLDYLHGIEVCEKVAGMLTQLRCCLLEAGVYVEFMAGAGRRSHGLPYVFPAMRIAPPLIAERRDLEAIVQTIRVGLQMFLKATNRAQIMSS